MKIRRGILDHLIAGTIGFFELAVYVTIHLQADYRTGVWTGSAPRLLATAPRGAKLRSVQRAIYRLAEIRFLRIFLTRGRRGNYRVLIHKFEPNTPALKGKRLNAFTSPSWQEPVYEDCADDDADDDTDVDADDALTMTPIQEVRSKNKEKPKSARARNRASRGAGAAVEDPAILDRFRQFAEAYPAHRRPTGGEWRKAMQLWCGLSENEQQDAIASLSKWTGYWAQDEPRYVLSMVRFIRLKRWQAPPPERQKGESHDGHKRPGSTTTQQHLDRLKRNAQALGVDLRHS